LNIENLNLNIVSNFGFSASDFSINVMRAVIFTGGKQYNVKEGDILKVELLKTNGKKTIFDKVLMTFDETSGEAKIGAPYLDGVKVEAEVLGDGQDKKVTVVKYHAKTRYRRKIGHRQMYTKVKITKIS